MGLLSESPMYERTSRRKLKRGAGVGAGLRMPFGSLWAGMRLRLCLYGPETGIGTFSSGALADSGCVATAASAGAGVLLCPDELDPPADSAADAVCAMPAVDAGSDVAGSPALRPSGAVAGCSELADRCDLLLSLLSLSPSLCSLWSAAAPSFTIPLPADALGPSSLTGADVDAVAASLLADRVDATATTSLCSSGIA